MSLIANAIGERAVADAEHQNQATKSPPKRTVTALKDTSPVPERR